jgi:hypothetical protein
MREDGIEVGATLLTSHTGLKVWKMVLRVDSAFGIVG